MNALLAAAVLVTGLAEVTEEIVLDCGSPCGTTNQKPEDRWDRPTCIDYDLDTALIDAMQKKGDRSARDLLLQRYANNETWSERHRIGGALLNHVSNDLTIWRELLEHATNVVRFPNGGHEPSPEYLQWCQERGLDPDDYWYMALRALEAAGRDPRSRALLLEALRTDDTTLHFVAVEALGFQRDESSLTAIEEVLERTADEASAIAFGLALFKSERADAIAMKYITEDQRAAYFELREQEP